MKQERKTAYADLIIERGINLRKGQSLVIKTGPGTYDFARILAKSAYAHGALFVNVQLDDLDLLASRLANQTIEDVVKEPHYLLDEDYEMISEDWAYIRIDNTEDRLDHAPFDAVKYQAYQKQFSVAHSAIMEKRMRHQSQWCVVCAAGPRWAQLVLGPEATQDEMWDLLSPILLLDHESPVQAWDEKDKVFAKRMEYMNSLKIQSLHFSSGVTDLTIGFRPQSLWLGGSDPLPDGSRFFPNLPTEEIFSVPDMYDVNGHVTTTRPVSVMNQPTEEVTLTFKDGVVVDCTARVGSDVMQKFLDIDEGSRRLGECALVDEDSPIAKSNKVFGSILYDENASCHIALGAGYPTCLSNGKNLTTKEQLHGEGCNTSLNHTDFMIGSPDMDIMATTAAGKQVPIMSKGHFVF